MKLAVTIDWGGKMKRKSMLLFLLFFSPLILSCAKKKEEETSMQLPVPAQIPVPQVPTSAGIDQLYIDYMVEQAKLSTEYVHKTTPADRAEYEKKAQAIREKYLIDRHPDFREYYATLPPEKQMEFMQKMDQAMNNAGLKR